MKIKKEKKNKTIRTRRRPPPIHNSSPSPHPPYLSIYPSPYSSPFRKSSRLASDFIAPYCNTTHKASFCSGGGVQLATISKRERRRPVPPLSTHLPEASFRLLQKRGGYDAMRMRGEARRDDLLPGMASVVEKGRMVILSVCVL